jgi:hypothetical protein
MIGQSSQYSTNGIGYNANNSIFVGAEPANNPTTPESGKYFE